MSVVFKTMVRSHSWSGFSTKVEEAVSEKKLSKKAQQTFGTYPHSAARRGLVPRDFQERVERIPTPTQGLGLWKFEDFKIIKELGSGQFGTVYKVKHLPTKRIYALKEIRVESTADEARFLKEYEMTIRGRGCPRIVQCYGKIVQEHKGRVHYVLVLEFIEGREFFEVIKERRHLPLAEARRYLAQIALALDHLHPLTVYRDLKPENILIDAAGSVKLCDFGLSRFCSGVERCKTSLGTPNYVAPEVWLQQFYDHSCDWWSLGVVFYQMLFGYNPFPNPEAVVQEAPHEPFNHHIPAEEFANAWSLINALLTKNPFNRLKTLTALKVHPFFEGYNWEFPDNPVSKKKKHCIIM